MKPRIIAGGLALLLMACTQGTAAPTSAPTGTTAASAPAGESPAAGGREFSVAFTTIGVGSVPLLAALDRMRDEGYTIEVVELDESDLAIQGVTQGTFAISSAGAPPIARAAGAELKVFVDRNDNEFTLYGTHDIASCEDLAGKRLAIHSEGATSTFMVRDYLEQNCPGTEPQYIVIAGSPNRYAALIAGEIDASPIELSEAIALEAEAGDRFHMITSFAESLPDLHNANVYAGTSFMEENPDTIRTLIRHLLEIHREIDGDAAALESLITEYWSEAPEATLTATAERYVELGLFDPNGGLDEEVLQATIDFYTDAGAIEDELTVDELADLSHLDAVLEEIGRQ